MMSEEELFSAAQAAEYLRRKWGLKRFSVETFRQYRRRHKIQPSIPLERASLWRRSDLDRIPRPRTDARQQEEPEAESEDDPEPRGKKLLTFAP